MKHFIKATLAFIALTVVLIISAILSMIVFVLKVVSLAIGHVSEFIHFLNDKMGRKSIEIIDKYIPKK